MPVKPVNSITIAAMISFSFLILFFSGLLELPSVSSSVQPIHDPITSAPEPFTDLVGAFRKWDSQVGYPRFRQKHGEVNLLNKSRTSSLQEIGDESECGRLKSSHVSVLVKGWTWIPDNLDNLYSC